MKVKVFDKNQNGKIEFTRKELEALLNEVYNEGYSEANAKHWSVTYGSSTGGITAVPTYNTTISCNEVEGEASNCVGDSYMVNYGLENDLPGQLSMFLGE